MNAGTPNLSLHVYTAILENVKRDIVVFILKYLKIKESG
jgi:septum formation topological specificity factor MinE